MLRGFLIIFVLCAIATLAVFGFRGRKSTVPPTEVFPDMVRQMKVRAQAPLGLFADGRGPRLPVAGRSLGDRHSGSDDTRADGARATAFQHHLRDVSWRDRSR